MSQLTSKALFIYVLLSIDLFVNITDELIAPRKLVTHTSPIEDVNNMAFVLVLIQIASILCAVSSLISHFLEAADQVIQRAVLIPCNGSHTDAIQQSPLRGVQLPRRSALKLVVDKYWWSLLVGSSYVVLTIILQIIRLDPDWHHRPKLMSHVSFPESSHANLSVADFLLDSREILQRENYNGHRDHIISGRYGSGENDNVSGDQSETTWMSIMVSMFHKLISTCYYVTFVVINRTSPKQMTTRILAQEPTLTFNML